MSGPCGGLRKVLALDPIDEAGLALLRARPDIELIHLPAPEEADIRAHMKDAAALILRARRLPDEMFHAAPALQLVSRHGVGCDNLNLDLLREIGVGVAIAADANMISVAEHALMLTLAACKNLMLAAAAARAGDWSGAGFGARDLAEEDVLVIGYGRIGRIYAARAAAFGARVTVHSPSLPRGAPLPSGYRREDDFHRALAGAGVISIHTPRTRETTGLFDTAAFARMRPGAILVNTARGGVVDEAALPSALDAGRPAFYATDVLAEEPPPPGHPLIRRDDVIVTPHTAPMTRQGAERMATRAAGNVLAWLDGTLAPEMTVLAPR